MGVPRFTLRAAAKAMAAGACLLLGSCAADHAGEEEGEADRAVLYGPEMAIEGRHDWTFESSEIHLCDRMPQQCAQARRYRRGCWLTFGADARRNLAEWERRNGALSPIAGQAWIGGRGRIAAGTFMGRYSCQVRMTTISRVEIISQVQDRRESDQSLRQPSSLN